LADDLFQPGFGAAAAFDFMLTPVIGFFAQGEYVGVGLSNVDDIPLIDGSVGAGFVWRFHDRMSLRADLMGGVYSVTFDDITISGISRAPVSPRRLPPLAGSMRLSLRRLPLLRLYPGTLHAVPQCRRVPDPDLSEGLQTHRPISLLR
jgi:hypothetical protein